MTLRLWLLATDAAHALDRGAYRLRGFTSALYLWTVSKASDAEWRRP